MVNLAQALGEFRLVPGEQAYSGGLGLGQLLGGSAHRLARMDHLGHGCGQAVGFQLGELGAKDGLGPAHRAKQLPGHARAQAGRQGKGEPSQVLVGGHRGRGQRTWLVQKVLR
jgi:hypothetical protein